MTQPAGKPATQRGVAIVLAMSVVALATIAATAIVTMQGHWARRSELQADHRQAQALVAAGFDWARSVLADDRLGSSVDHAGEPWALRLAPVPLPEGEISGFIRDEQGAFNLNNLLQGGRIRSDQLDHFRRLLAILGLPPGLAETLADWLDADAAPHPLGAEDGYYLSLGTPYLAANAPLSDMAELHLVRGFDPDVVARLAPFVTVLPAFTPVNVNTAPAEVLSAIVPGLQLDDARAMVAGRERAYFRDRTDFLSRLPPGVEASREDVDVGSRYFSASVRVSIRDAGASGTALLARLGPGWPQIVWTKQP